MNAASKTMIKLTFAAEGQYLVSTINFLSRGLELNLTVKPGGLRIQPRTPCCRSFQAWPGEPGHVLCGRCARIVPEAFLQRWDWAVSDLPEPLLPYLEALLIGCRPEPDPLTVVLEAAELEAHIIALTGSLGPEWPDRWATIPSEDEARALVEGFA